MKNISIVGNLGQDPQIGEVNGKKTARISVACRNGKDASGQEIAADWFEATFWESQAETIEKYVLKGDKIAVCGELEIHHWEGQNGAGISYRIKNARFELIGKVEKQQSGPGSQPAQRGQQQSQPTRNINNTKAPF